MCYNLCTRCYTAELNIFKGGFVENGDNHVSTATKETKEEAGIDIILKGVLAIQSSIQKHGARQRAILFAVPKDLDQLPKSVPDAESKGAQWMTVKQLEEKEMMPPPFGLRGMELLEWAKYLEDGGSIYPMSMLHSSEHEKPEKPSKEEIDLMAKGIKIWK